MMDDLGSGMPPESPVAFPGPFEHHDVVVHGHAVPLLSATPHDGGHVRLHLDRRFALDLTVAEAERVVPFLAECLAVAQGYSCHPCAEVPEPAPLRAAVPVHSV